MTPRSLSDSNGTYRGNARGRQQPIRTFFAARRMGINIARPRPHLPPIPQRLEFVVMNSTARLIAAVACGALLATAVAMGNAPLATATATFFVLYTSLQLVSVVNASRRYRDGAPEPWGDAERLDVADRVAHVLEAAIILAGLATFAGLRSAEDFGLAGTIVWIGSIGVWFAGGVIAREVGGVPVTDGPRWLAGFPKATRRSKLTEKSRH